MNPIDNNQQFTHDYHKFVFQEPNVWQVTSKDPPPKFSIDKPEKTKKDVKKDKKPKNRNKW